MGGQIILRQPPAPIRRIKSLSENLIWTFYGPSTVLSVAAESEDIQFEESDRTNGRLPVRGVRLLNMCIFGLRFIGELVEPFVAVFG